jgi:hypothetical protein
MTQIKNPILMNFQKHMNSGTYRTALEILDVLQAEGWNLDIGSNMSRQFFGRVTPNIGFKVLAASQYMNQQQRSDYSFIRPATGKWIHIKQALTAQAIKNLIMFCDKCFPHPGTQPRALHTLVESVETTKVFTMFGLVSLLQYLAREVQPDMGESLTIISPRTLLRRTYPITTKYNDPSMNMHNQHWHQDSNSMFGARPMLTIWIPLQSESGICRPGINIMNVPTNRFHSDIGDGYQQAKEELVKEFGEIEINTPLIDAGDAVVFNGLTFHQTFSTENMLHHRDALLIRIVRSHEAIHFPGDRNDDVVVRL